LDGVHGMCGTKDIGRAKICWNEFKRLIGHAWRWRSAT
jgi:hypothetical protein